MINFILNHQKFKSNPPVFFDLGAGGDQKTDWAVFYDKSHVYKLDANDNIEDSKQNIKQTTINETLFDKKTTTNFNITKSIFCSSLLKPNFHELQNWIFKNKFDLKKKNKVKTKTIRQILREKNIKNIDWIKLDLQGIDLKIFKSIPLQIRKKIIIVEFEPGLYNFYNKEGKLSDILNYMEKEYFIEEFKFTSSIRSNYKFFNTFQFFQKKSLNLINKKTKFYTNITFLKKNNFLSKNNLRSVLLMIAILVSKKRYVEALEVIIKYKKFDPIFKILEKKILLKIRFGIFLYFINRPYYLLKSCYKLFKRKI